MHMGTKEKILDKALEMFNERGVEYVGVRELAALLDMRVSNISYYFPTKDDLVNELSLQLGALNSKVMKDDKNLSLLAFLQMLRQVFGNHLRYRCLLLSFVHIMEQNKVVAKRYQQVQSQRKDVIRANLETLVQRGYLSLPGEDDLEYLVSSISLIARFWISEAVVSFRHLAPHEQMRHYLLMIVKLLSPFAAPTAKPELEVFTHQLTQLQPEHHA
jgi:AcrR family transcriptional regulator